MEAILIIVGYFSIALIQYFLLYIGDIKEFKKLYPKGGDFNHWYENTPREYCGGIGFNVIVSLFWIVFLPIRWIETTIEFMLKIIRRYYRIE